MPGPKTFAPGDHDRALAEIIRTRREKKKLTQADLARAIGMSVRSVHRMEKAERAVSMHELAALEQILGRFRDAAGVLTGRLDLPLDEKLPGDWTLLKGALDEPSAPLSIEERIVLHWFRRLDRADQVDMMDKIIERAGFAATVAFLEKIVRDPTSGATPAGRKNAARLLHEIEESARKQGRPGVEPSPASAIWWTRAKTGRS